MRPITLTLTAFGPFATTQVIDFRQALEGRLFGIYGPTGAGKTSILDGVCFALFGESSGDERQGDDLRSHHATSEVETEARLVFEVGAKRYHVVRRPRQTVQGKRSDQVQRQHWAALYDATGLEVDAITADNPGVVLEERKVEVVADRLRAILSYSAEQFRQVVLLPQGKFRELLTATSDKRSEVLRGLFDVSLYERLVDRLKDEAAALRDSVQSGRAAITGHLTAHDVGDVEALAAFGERLAQDQQQQTEVRDTARTVQTAARAVVQAADAAEERFLESIAATAALAEVEANAAQVEAVRLRLEAAEKAVGCAGVDARALEAEAELRKASEAQTGAAGALAEKEAEASGAVADMQASTARQDERDAAASAVVRLEGFQTRVADAGALRTTAESAAAQLETARARLADATGAQDDAERIHGVAVADHQSAQEGAVRRLQLDTSRTALLQAKGQAADFKKATEAVARLASDRDAARIDHRRLGEALTKARADEQTAEVAMATAQASHLARGLEAGSPCPVCGSLEHPHPAGQAEEGQGLDAQWRSARQLAEAADAQERSAAQVASRADGEWAQAAGRLAETSAPELTLEDIEIDLASVEADLAVLGAARDLESSAHVVETAKTRRDAAVTSVEAARAKFAASDRAAASATATLDASLADIPPAARTMDGVAEQLQLAMTHRDDLATAHRIAADAERRASAAVQDARSALGHANDQVTTVTRARDTHLAAFESAKAGAGLVGGAYEAAKSDIPEREAFKKTISDHGAATAAAVDRVRRASEAVEGLERPDLVACSAALATADASLAEAEETLAKTALRRGQVEATRTKVAALAEALAADEARYRTLGELVALTDGRNAHRLRLRDFAIAATFDLVLEAANQRFARMSRGRFTLLRKVEGGDARSRAGLDIEVHDAHTDQKRDAHTLSGGEGFLASLSLALGLSDVVQAEAGGVKLDAIFIDEGFGHLDDETLDIALDTLRDLVGQERAVGVISHVDAVKVQIPLGFDVVRAPQGSVVNRRMGMGHD